MSRIFSFDQYLAENSNPPLTSSQIEFLNSGNSGESDWKYDEETGLVDYYGDFHMSHSAVKTIPVKFGRVFGDFNASFGSLESLDGVPKQATSVYLQNNKISNLEGFSARVSSVLNLSYNPISSFIGCSPDIYVTTLYAYECKLFSLEGIDQPSFRSFNFESNPVPSDFLFKIYGPGSVEDYYRLLMERYSEKVMENWEFLDEGLKKRIAESQDTSPDDYEKYVKAMKIIY